MCAMKQIAISKPIIIDYPEDRTRLKEEFTKIASRPGFAESVALAKEMLHGSRKPAKRRTPRRRRRA
jgi:hypothetical protein